MPKKAKIAAIALATFVHGLTLYFAVAGILGIHTTILTAIFQIGTLLIGLYYTLYNPEARRKLFRIGFFEILYFAFMILIGFDLVTMKDQSNLPDNFVIYTSVYWFALILLRSLSFDQLRIFCYVTTCLATLTSSILFVQVITGSASLVDNGGRLSVGTSGNPIIAGYTGAYCCLASLILWIKSPPDQKLFWLACSAPGFFVCVSSGTRSATLSLVLAGGLIGLYVLNIVTKSGKTFTRFLSNTFLVAGILGMLLILAPLASNPASANSKADRSPLEVVVENGNQRIQILVQMFTGGGGGDMSIQGREALYATAIEAINDNPVFGKGLYAAGGAHNVFLQVTAEFGLLGVITFILPFLLLIYQVFNTLTSAIASTSSWSYHTASKFLRSDYWMVSSFAVVMLVQGISMFSFHGDPYRSYLPIASIGILIAFLRLNHRSLQKFK
ncbi:O-antigen ligase family protein [Leptolyngbya sp. AN10]|uniref:O-antigen ligase family protein n=1 Tax=Leptolyngbya sp. AN10 TaxID=3423365 RepID=UPI003D31232A